MDEAYPLLEKARAFRAIGTAQSVTYTRTVTTQVTVTRNAPAGK